MATYLTELNRARVLAGMEPINEAVDKTSLPDSPSGKVVQLVRLTLPNKSEGKAWVKRFSSCSGIGQAMIESAKRHNETADLKALDEVSEGELCDIIANRLDDLKINGYEH